MNIDLVFYLCSEIFKLSLSKLCYNFRSPLYGGDIGFDADIETQGACRGRSILVKRHYKFIVAKNSSNDAVYDSGLVAIAA